MSIRDLLTKPLTTITLSSINSVIGSCETDEVEFKGPLPWKEKGNPEPWESGLRRLGDYTKNEITAEIIGLANAGGGVLLLGMNDDKDGNASSLHPLPDPQELAERLYRVLESNIEPYIPNLEIHHLITEAGKGVVICRVPQSWLRPHKHQQYGHCFVRRGTSTVQMSMREVRDMINLGDSGRIAIERTLERSRLTHPSILAARLQFEFRVHALPTIPLATGPIPRTFVERVPVNPVYLEAENDRLRLSSPLQLDIFRPAVRAWQCSGRGTVGRSTVVIEESGAVQYNWIVRDSQPSTSHLISYQQILCVLCNALLCLSRLRSLAARPYVQYVLESQILKLGDYTLVDQSTNKPIGALADEIFPQYLVGPESELDEAWRQFFVDLHNSVGIEAIAPVAALTPLS
ncbi:MAG: helix-turn-helix domain-containing protein [Reyranellaceae bacterium]